MVTGNVTGEVRDVNANLLTLTGVEVSLYEYDGSFYDSDTAYLYYCIEVDQTGDYWLLGTTADYYETDTNDMLMMPPLHIDLTTPEKLAAGYVFDFEGNYGLVPRTCDMWYAQKSVNLWLFPPNSEWALDEWKAMDSIHSWQFPN